MAARNGSGGAVVRLVEIACGVNPADAERGRACISHRNGLRVAGGRNGLCSEDERGRIERDRGLRGAECREQRYLPDPPAICGGAKLARASIAGRQLRRYGELNDGRIGQIGAVDAPAVCTGAGGDLPGNVDAGIERDVDGVSVVGIDDDAVGRSVGQVAGDIGPVPARVGRAVEMRRVDAVPGEAHHRGIHRLSGGVVRIGGNRGDIEAARVEDAEIGPRRRAVRGVGGSGREKMAAHAAAAVERTGHARVESLGTGVLRGGGGAGRASGGERANHGIGAAAGGVLWPAEELADGVRRRPRRSAGSGTAPDAARPDEDVGGECRVEQPWRVDQRGVVGGLRRADDGSSGEVRCGAVGSAGALADADARAGGDIPALRIAWVDGNGTAFAGGELRPRCRG